MIVMMAKVCTYNVQKEASFLCVVDERQGPAKGTFKKRQRREEEADISSCKVVCSLIIIFGQIDLVTDNF